jgi:hypothetical protein
MRSFTSTIIGTRGNVSVGRRNRRVVAGTYVLGSLHAPFSALLNAQPDAQLDARFLLAWLTRHVQAAWAALAKRPAQPAARRAMWAPEPACSGVATSRSGLGGPGSGIPSGRF